MKKPVLTMGVFDGVHRGHRAIMKQVVARAKALGGTAVAYTFDPHPVRILAPQAAPAMLNTLEQRVELILQQGIQKVLVENFTKTFSQQSPEVFFREVILGRLKPVEIFVGYNFTFGIHRSGTVETLKKLGADAGVRVTIVQPQFNDEVLVSSTQVRQHLAHADLEGASRLLDRVYFMEGQVIQGRGIGGKQLGIHTANLDSENDLILPTGVYVTKTHVLGKPFTSVTNIGPNPTFGGKKITIETHILDFEKGLMGKKMRVDFLKKLRDEIQFSSPADLAAQIGKDIASTRAFFGKKGKT